MKRKKHARFEGWYYKHQAKDGPSLAIIPGRAADHAFVLINTGSMSHHIRYPLSEYRRGEILRVGSNTFSQHSITLDIPELNLAGAIKYTNLTPIRYDIMGPFKFFPMECRHSITSMRHTLHGNVTMNGIVHDYSGGLGYIESDSGRSFPSGYAWVHCNDFRKDCSIMASVAQIPFSLWHKQNDHIKCSRLPARLSIMF